MSFETPIKLGTNLDLGNAIETLIKKNIQNINTCFIAKIISIKNNKVDVVDIIKNNENTENPIIYNCLIAQPFSSQFNINFKLKENDIGICIVSKKDISNFKNNKNEIINTQRLFSISDSIFLPLSLLNSNIEKNEIYSKDDLLIKGKDIDIKSENPIVIGSAAGSLLNLTNLIIQLLDLLASGMTGSTTNPSAYQNAKNAIIQQIEQIVG